MRELKPGDFIRVSVSIHPEDIDEEIVSEQTYLIYTDGPYSDPTRVVPNAARALISALIGAKTSPSEGGR